MRPLMSVQETKMSLAMTGQGNRVKGPKKTYDTPHSKASADRSEQYHAEILGSNPAKIKRLNPTKSIPASRSFPGL